MIKKNKNKIYIIQLKKKNENLTYFDFNYDEKFDESENEIFVNIVYANTNSLFLNVLNVKNVQCCCFKKKISFNNLFHKHLKIQKCNIIKICNMKNNSLQFLSIFFTRVKLRILIVF